MHGAGDLSVTDLFQLGERLGGLPDTDEGNITMAGTHEPTVVHQHMLTATMPSACADARNGPLHSPSPTAKMSQPALTKGWESQQPSLQRTQGGSVDVQATTATLTTCEVDDRVVYRTSDGSAVNTKVSTARWSVAMTYEDGVWKIAGRQQLQTWDGQEMEACLAAPRS